MFGLKAVSDIDAWIAAIHPEDRARVRAEWALELERTHQALMGASHQAGMAEVATNVLHNVGNALNSINVSANLLETRLRQIRVGGLSRVADLLGQQGSNLGAVMASRSNWTSRVRGAWVRFA